MQDDDDNDTSPPSSPTAASGFQRCVACPVFISRDWPRHLWLFRADLPAMEESTSSWGKNVMSLLTGGEQAIFFSWIWSQSRYHRVDLFLEKIDTFKVSYVTTSLKIHAVKSFKQVHPVYPQGWRPWPSRNSVMWVPSPKSLSKPSTSWCPPEFWRHGERW